MEKLNIISDIVVIIILTITFLYNVLVVKQYKKKNSNLERDNKKLKEDNHFLKLKVDNTLENNIVSKSLKRP